MRKWTGHLKNLFDQSSSMHQSIFAPESLTTLDHLRTSPSISLANSAGACPPGSAPKVFQIAASSEPASALATSCCKRETVSGEVPAGAQMPYHVPASKPGTPTSASVGTLGSAKERLAVVTASGSNLPVLYEELKFQDRQT